MRTLRTALGLALALGAGGCSATPTDDTPTGALKLFLAAMDRSEWDEDALAEAYALMSHDAREALAERARTAEALSGRDLEPWKMIPQGRFRLRFSPRRQGGMREQVDGASAVVVVTGNLEGERAEVPMVLEDDGWRVVLELPPLRPE
jgi:hypothetical protein